MMLIIMYFLIILLNPCPLNEGDIHGRESFLSFQLVSQDYCCICLEPCMQFLFHFQQGTDAPTEDGYAAHPQPPDRPQLTL